MPGTNTNKRRNVAKLALVFALGGLALVAPSVAAAGTLDQSQTATNAAVSFGQQREIAQIFTAGASGNLDQVDLYGRRNSCSGGSGLIVEIRTLSGSVPSNTVLAATTVAVANVPTANAWFSAGFASPAAVSAGTRYALVLSAPDARCKAAGLPYDWRGALGNPYGGGAAYYTNTGGSSWTIQSSGDFDTAFKTYVAPASSPGEPTPPPETGPPPSTPDPIARRLGIRYAEKKDAFRGRLISQSPACVSAQKVKVFEGQKGKDPRVGKATTQANGKYLVEEKNPEGRFYAKVKQTSTSAGTCLAAKPGAIKVG